jgi:hypothetical protein
VCVRATSRPAARRPQHRLFLDPTGARGGNVRRRRKAQVSSDANFLCFLNVVVGGLCMARALREGGPNGIQDVGPEAAVVVVVAGGK